MKILVAPSILAGDFGRLNEEIKRIEKAGADLIHIDVMDGHFVPNITIGPRQVSAIKKSTRLPLDVHLMIEEPFKLLDDFVNAGSDIITVHIENVSLKTLKARFKELRAKNVRLGVALKPKTSIKAIASCIDYLDFILLMSVNPGFCGQKFMPLVYPKIENLRKVYNLDIEVDGGVNNENAPRLISCGANVLVAGNYIFKSKDISQAVRSLRA
ncbi:MAG: ribulose-phosphate 3-epimerase [Candidatus Omnitrophica bacterium]|nr:ribulose-phosphate 3-epimerase [Candidatus Omnitrophota bacterium]